MRGYSISRFSLLGACQQYGIGLAEVDDFRLVLQRMTTPAHYPALHFFLSADILQWPVETLRDQLVAVNQIVSSALEIVIANHVATNTPCILEGDGILPAFAAQQSFAQLEGGRAVRAAFIIERDKDRLFHNMQMRGRSFDTFSSRAQHQWGELSWQYGQWLEDEAIRCGIPVVPAQPWNTLAERIRAAIEA